MLANLYIEKITKLVQEHGSLSSSQTYKYCYLRLDNPEDTNVYYVEVVGDRLWIENLNPTIFNHSFLEGIIKALVMKYKEVK